MVVGAHALLIGGCIAPDSDVIDVAEGCDEFQVGQELDPSLEVDPLVRQFLEATSDFSGASAELRDAVYVACSNIATDLGVADSWSSIEDLDERVHNDAGTGACDAASREVERRLIEAGGVEGSFAVAVTKGECHFDFARQRACEDACLVNAPCDPGTVETRCEPGSLSVICDTECSASARCLGTPELPANCMGVCESTCQGECRGACIAPDGTRTIDDPNCRGKCSSSCNGTCRGICRVEAPVQCGASVRCSGGCTGTFTDPVCTASYMPPSCMVDPSCIEACAADVAANAVCDPTQVEVFVDLVTSPELEPVVATLEANLPALIDAAELRGRVILAATEQLATVGEDLSGRLEELDGKSLACVGVAGGHIARAVQSATISVDASVDLSVKVDTNAS
jgi:hypothetical protein